MERLAAFLEEQRAALGRLVVVFGVLGDKDWRGMLARLEPLADVLILTRPPTERAADPLAVRDALPGTRRAEVQADVPEALAQAEWLAGAEGTVLACGSLYTVGAVLQTLGAATPPAIPLHD
jgi:dihydrofolate synthase/folylpolyglutamate synthase